jgi:hypothetical protein
MRFSLYGRMKKAIQKTFFPTVPRPGRSAVCWGPGCRSGRTSCGSLRSAPAPRPSAWTHPAATPDRCVSFTGLYVSLAFHTRWFSSQTRPTHAPAGLTRSESSSSSNVGLRAQSRVAIDSMWAPLRATHLLRHKPICSEPSSPTEAVAEHIHPFRHLPVLEGLGRRVGQEGGRPLQHQQSQHPEHGCPLPSPQGHPDTEIPRGHQPGASVPKRVQTQKVSQDCERQVQS